MANWPASQKHYNYQQYEGGPSVSFFCGCDMTTAGETPGLIQVGEKWCDKFENTGGEANLPAGMRRSGSLSRLPDERPPDIEEEYYPRCHGCRICFPIRFPRSHAMFVYLPDGKFARRTDVHVKGHILHAFRAFFGNMPAGVAGVNRGAWCIHVDLILS